MAENPRLRIGQGQPPALIRGMGPWPGGTPLWIQVGPLRLMIVSQGDEWMNGLLAEFVIAPSLW